MSEIIVTGIRELDDELKKLGLDVQTKIASAGIRSALKVLYDFSYAAVSAQPVSSPHPDSMKAGMRRILGYRFSRLPGETERSAKVGFGVGNMPDIRYSEGETFSVGQQTPSLGVRPSTKHWFALGTSNMPAYFEGCLDKAFAAGAEPAAQAALRTMKRRLERAARQNAR